MSDKGTAGPWRAAPVDGYEATHLEITGATGLHVATVSAGQRGLQARQRADAELIALAPAMREALTRVRDIYDACTHTTKEQPGLCDACCHGMINAVMDGLGVPPAT